jgi:hypothetical protein
MLLNAVALKLKKRDGKIADNTRKKAKRAEEANKFSEVGLLVTTAAAKAALKAKTLRESSYSKRR